MSDATQIIEEVVLVLRCQAGDEAAFTEVVRRYHPRLHYYVKKMLGNAHRADDATQEVWIDVLRSIARLRDPGAFAAWLYRLARDRVYRMIRSARPPATPLDERELADPGEAAEFSADDAAQLHAALDALRPAHRDVLLLRFVEGMSYPQIASVVGCELGTVRSRIHYAKRAARQWLERNDHEPRLRIRNH